MKNAPRTVKILLLGDSFVGKTALLQRYTNNTFQPVFLTTIGIDFRTTSFEHNGVNVKLQIWDTAGQERFGTITNSYIRGSDGIVLVYDVTNIDSFNNINRWMNQINEYIDKTNVKFILAGNKQDLTKQRMVSEIDGYKLAKNNFMKYIPTSAKDGMNVDLLFSSIAKHIISSFKVKPDIIQEMNEKNTRKLVRQSSTNKSFSSRISNKCSC